MRREFWYYIVMATEVTREMIDNAEMWQRRQTLMAIAFVSEFGQSTWWEEATLQGCLFTIFADYDADEDDEMDEAAKLVPEDIMYYAMSKAREWGELQIVPEGFGIVQTTFPLPNQEQ